MNAATKIAEQRLVGGGDFLAFAQAARMLRPGWQDRQRQKEEEAAFEEGAPPATAADANEVGCAPPCALSLSLTVSLSHLSLGLSAVQPPARGTHLGGHLRIKKRTGGGGGLRAGEGTGVRPWGGARASPPPRSPRNVVLGCLRCQDSDVQGGGFIRSVSYRRTFMSAGYDTDPRRLRRGHEHRGFSDASYPGNSAAIIVSGDHRAKVRSEAFQARRRRQRQEGHARFVWEGAAAAARASASHVAIVIHF